VFAAFARVLIDADFLLHTAHYIPHGISPSSNDLA
jgi:hypothetical protein